MLNMIDIHTKRDLSRAGRDFYDQRSYKKFMKLSAKKWSIIPIPSYRFVYFQDDKTYIDEGAFMI